MFTPPPIMSRTKRSYTSVGTQAAPIWMRICSGGMSLGTRGSRNRAVSSSPSLTAAFHLARTLPEPSSVDVTYWPLIGSFQTMPLSFSSAVSRSVPRSLAIASRSTFPCSARLIATASTGLSAFVMGSWGRMTRLVKMSDSPATFFDSGSQRSSASTPKLSGSCLMSLRALPCKGPCFLTNAS